jgi:hypothetical protein
MGPREEVEELDRILCRVCMRPSPQLAYCRPSEDYRPPGDKGDSGEAQKILVVFCLANSVRNKWHREGLEQPNGIQNSSAGPLDTSVAALSSRRARRASPHHNYTSGNKIPRV